MKPYPPPFAIPETPIIAARTAPIDPCRYLRSQSVESSPPQMPRLRMREAAVPMWDQLRHPTEPSRLTAWNMSTSLAVEIRSCVAPPPRTIARPPLRYQLYRWTIMLVKFCSRRLAKETESVTRCAAWQEGRKDHGWSRRSGLARNLSVRIKHGEP